MNADNLYTMALTQYPDVLTVKDVRNILHVSRQTAYKLIRTGKLPGFISGKGYIVPKYSVLEYLSAACAA